MMTEGEAKSHQRSVFRGQQWPPKTDKSKKKCLPIVRIMASTTGCSSHLQLIKLHIQYMSLMQEITHCCRGLLFRQNKLKKLRQLLLTMYAKRSYN